MTAMSSGSDIEDLLPSTRCTSPVLFTPSLDNSDKEPLHHGACLEVRRTPYGGRGFFNRHDNSVPAGSVVMECQTPFAAVVYRPFKKEVCANCFNYDNGKTQKIRLKQLPDGRAYAGLYFCSSRCKDLWVDTEDYDGLLSQTLDLIEVAYQRSLKAKKPSCKDVYGVSSTVSLLERAQGAPAANATNTQLLLDSVWTRIDSEPESAKTPVSIESEDYDMARLVATVTVQKYRALVLKDPLAIQRCAWFDMLQSNEAEVYQQFPTMLPYHIGVYKFLTTCLPTDIKSQFSSQLLRQTVGREAGNAFGIWQLPLNLESECFGAALYAEASFFNHSCDPSVKKERVGRSMVFTSIKPVSPGQEFYISYGMIQHLSYQQRQQKLRDQWHFACQCSRCVQEQQVAS